MPRTSGTSRQRGFTLLELIVGLTVGAILLAAIFTTFVGVSQTQKRVELVLDRTSSWRFLTESFHRDFSRISPTSSFSGSAVAVSFEFFEGPQGAPKVAEYFLEGSTLTRTVGTATTRVDLPKGYKQPKFRYKSREGWIDEVESTPTSVEISLVTPRGSLSRIFTVGYDGPRPSAG